MEVDEHPPERDPITIHGHPYVVEIDEFGALDEVGAGRIIDIKDETKPKVVSNLRLEVHQPKNFDKIKDDPGASNNFVGSYAGHYCNVPKRTNPRIVACSMILSGLRVFDIRDPKNPREIAYFNAPVSPNRHLSRPEQLGDVKPRVRAETRRNLVLRRPDRLLRCADRARHLAIRRRRGQRLRLPTTRKTGNGTHRDDSAGETAMERTGVCGDSGYDELRAEDGRESKHPHAESEPCPAPRIGRSAWDIRLDGGPHGRPGTCRL